MMKFNLIVAVCENFGIGIKGDLPWRLKSELKYFSNTTKKVNNSNKRNAVIMGRLTYLGIPPNKRPLPDRLNIILSNNLKANDVPADVLLYPNLEKAMQRLEQDDMRALIENVWVVGGSGVYKEALSSERCHRLYITEIMSNFECDTFFPDIPNDFVEVSLDEGTPKDVQEENGIRFKYKVLEKKVIS